MSFTTTLNVPVFAGQGTAAANSPATRKQAKKDASSSAGSLLLAACYGAFHSELSSLSQDVIPKAGIDTSDFKNVHTFLDVPSDCYLNNPIITCTTLFLLQSLRYLAYVEASGAAEESFTPFNDVLKGNLENDLGILGFSSGILPAVVAATSFNIVSYISRSVEAYRLAIWIGIRTQQYRDQTNVDDYATPWSLVFLGLDKKSAEEAIAAFNSDTPLTVTAVLDNKSVTISGRPDVLDAFSRSIPASVTIHKTSVDTLYHSSLHSCTLREQVLADVIARGITFPEYTDIKVPVRSTFTGAALTKKNTGSLLESVVDMIITQPVNWDLVIQEFIKVVPTGKNIRLLNLGPGTGLTRSLERVFPRDRVYSQDLTAGNPGEKTKPKQDPIAIVGMGVHMPGARSTEEFWRVLEDGINTISEVPGHRFKVSDYNNSKDSKIKRQMKARTGNFIDGVDEFDNKFFKISPREAKSMDPQQRILLQVAYEALESAGYVPDSTPTWRTDSVGCYIGVATHDYLQNLRDDIDVYYSTGTLKAFLSGRISYAMQLSGPSVVVDTACSSSVVAVYQGCRALMNGDCSAAIVGGVNVISSPDMMLGLDRAHFLSPTGQCKAFDASADGYSRSEGCGIFVLKKLSDAVVENDNILGVIRGIEVNQSGLAHSITHPHAPTQAVLFNTLLESTGVEANRVSVIEAHGAGTQAGDPNELKSIRSIFAIGRGPGNPLHVTSVKANIGHLEAASGSAGLAKLLLMFKHRTIPRVVSLKNLNPLIAPLESDNTVIDTVQTEWNALQDQTRIAVLNNFGAAGSNAAMLLEEFRPVERVDTPSNLAYVFGLSAKTGSSLEELRSRYIQWLNGPNSTVNLADIAYTMTARRRIYEYRIAVQANSKEELIGKLSQASPTHVQDGMGKVVFVFSGQGGQYLGMGKALYETSKVFKKYIDECHRFLVGSGFPGITQIILAGEEGSGLTTLEQFEAYQAAIFSLEYSLAKVWMSWGLIPAAVVGHSLGEYAALVTAGVISLKGALMIIANRVRFMIQKCAVETTGMVAVNASQEVVAEAIKSSADFSGLNIACYNSATDYVISGPITQIKAFKAHLDAEVHCKNVILSVPFGYHSPAMAPLLEDLTAVARTVTISAPTIPIVSNVFGDIVAPGDNSVFNVEYFAKHCAEPVQFDKGICSLISKADFGKVDAWLEIGPHTTCLPMLRANASLSKDALLLGSLKKQQPAWSILATSSAQLYLTAIPLKWRQAFSHVDVTCAELPSYPFVRTKFWIPFKESETTATLASEIQLAPTPTSFIHEFKMLGAWIQHPSKANGNVAIFETSISDLAGSIRGHAVGGIPLCPASVYLEQVLAGVELVKRHLGLRLNDSHAVLRKVEFAKPLVYNDSVARTVITNVSLTNDCGVFSVSSRVGNSEESVHVQGEYRCQAASETSNKFNRVFPIVSRQISAVQEPKGVDLPEVFSTRTAYEVIFPRVVDYSKEYHTMQSVTVDPSGMEGVASVRLPVDHDKGSYIVHPVFMDTLLHVAGFLANMQGGVNDAYICSQVGTVKAIPEHIDNNASYTVYINNSWVESEGVTIAEAYAVLDSNPRRIVAHFKGMHFRRVRLNSLKKSLSHAAGTTSQGTSRPNISAMPVSTQKVAIAATTGTSPIDVSGEIMRIVAEICDISLFSVDLHTDLGSLGVDSLMSIEMFGKLQATFPTIELDAHALSHCQSVNDIVCEVSQQAKDLSVSQLTPSATLATAAPIPIATNPRIDVTGFVSKIVSDTCDISLSAIGLETDLGSLGVDSLMSIEIFGKLEEAFPSVDLNASALSRCRSISDILKHVPVAFASARACSESSVVSSPRTPLASQEKLAEPPSLNIDRPNIKEMLATILDISLKDITDDSDLESLGLDSLTSIEALGALKSEFNLEVPSDFFYSHKTARAVQSYLATHIRV